MSIRNVSHVAIGVRDIDRVLPFWTEVVGLHVDLDTSEEWQAKRVRGEATEPVRRRAVYLRQKGGKDEPFVVLDQQLSEAPRGEVKDLFEIGVHHFGFWVDDVESIAERARIAGSPILHEPGDNDSVAYGERPGGVIRALLVLDPESNVVQFDQRVG